MPGYNRLTINKPWGLIVITGKAALTISTLKIGFHPVPKIHPRNISFTIEVFTDTK